MKKILILLCCAILVGCSGNGVSQEQYESVVAERDAYKAQLESISGIVEESKADSGQTAKAEKKQRVQKEQKKLAIEVVAEYTLPTGAGLYTEHFMVIKNNSSQTMDISTSSLAYDKDAQIIAAAEADFYALGAGCTSVLCETFQTGKEIDHYEMEMNASESKFYESVIQDLSYIQNDVDRGAVFQVTNNGEESARFVQGYALFFNGDRLVGSQNSFFVEDDSWLKPGKTISKQVTMYKDFDRIEFYLSGTKPK